MKRLVLLIITVLTACTAAFAVPAWRGLFKYTQPDGSVVTLQKHGDEFFHWTTDVSGLPVELDASGYWRPVNMEDLKARRRAAAATREQNNVRRRSRRRDGEALALGQKHYLVILVEFKDVSFKSPTAKEDFTRLLNEPGYNENGGTGSARDFYYDNSHGRFEPIFDVYGPVKLENKMAYYGANNSSGDDVAPEKAVAEGCQALADQIDFSLYDNDNDGDVDLVFMYYAGYGEADGGAQDSIWPHQWEMDLSGVNLSIGGKKINKYACTNELTGYYPVTGKMCGIGTACHEFGHAMGLPDMYDIDYDKFNGAAGGLYDYSTMCDGSYNNNGRTPPYFTFEERIFLGWLSEDAYSEFTKSGSYELAGINNNEAYRTHTDIEGEYFAYECRSKEGWDAYIPESGLIVYHIDKSPRLVRIHDGESYISVTAKSLWDDWEKYNAINENGSHPCCYVVPAGDQSSLNYYGTKFAFPGSARKKSFTATSWNGVASEIALSDIAYSANKVTLTATVPPDDLDYAVIANPGNGKYRAGDSFAPSLLKPEGLMFTDVAWFFDDEPLSSASVLLRPGPHTVEAVLTLAGGTKTVTLEISVE